MIIRKSTQEDATGISTLISTLTEKYILPTCRNDSSNLLLGSMTADSIRRYIADGYQYHVAEDESGIIGVVGIKNNSHLYHLFVADSHQGQGISKKLWQHAKGVCLKNGNPGVFTVNAALNAKNVYLKFGFLQTGDVQEKLGIKNIPMQIKI